MRFRHVSLGLVNTTCGIQEGICASLADCKCRCICNQDMNADTTSQAM